MVVAVALGAALVAGCSDDASKQEPSSSGQPAGSESQQGQAPPEQPPPPPPKPKDKSIGDMSEAELEAACFEGRKAACDRLGH